MQLWRRRRDLGAREPGRWQRALLTALALMSSGCQSRAGAAADPLPTALRPGRDYFQARCGGCHGEHAEGSPRAPSLAGFVALPEPARAARLALATARGLPPTKGAPWMPTGMPPTGALRDAERAAILAWLAYALAPTQRDTTLRSAAASTGLVR